MGVFTSASYYDLDATYFAHSAPTMTLIAVLPFTTECNRWPGKENTKRDGAHAEVLQALKQEIEEP